MESKLTQPLAGTDARTPVIWFVTIFAIVTYLAISMRATLNPWEVNYFIDAKRILFVFAGAGLFWLAIRAAENNSDRQARDQISAILNISVPGVLMLLLGRELYDLAGSGELAQELSLNLRWMLNWVGYFAAAVAAFVALCYYRQLQSVRAELAAAAMVAPKPVATDRMAEIAVDALTAEIAATPGKDKQMLLLGLQASSVYELADKAFDPSVQARKQRQILIHKLSKRLAARI